MPSETITYPFSTYTKNDQKSDVINFLFLDPSFMFTQVPTIVCPTMVDGPKWKLAFWYRLQEWLIQVMTVSRFPIGYYILEK